MYQYGSIAEIDWWIGNIYDSSVRFCVPVFLMISGALILSKTYENLKEYLIKRVLRVLLPFLFWSAIYIAIDIFGKLFKGEQMTFSEILSLTFLKLKNGASFHLWYIYLIIGLYLFFPILNKWLLNSNKTEITYFLAIWSIIVLANFFSLKEFFPNIELSYFSGYIGFPVLGYYLNTLSFNRKNQKMIYWSLILTGVLITIAGTYFETYHRGKFYSGFYDYLSPNVILTSIGVFLFFKDFVRFDSKIILFFNQYSYGIYLIHMLILTLLKKLGLSYAFIHPIVGIPATSTLCLIISGFIIWGVNKVPWGKYISG